MKEELQLSRCQRVGKTLYDRETGTILTRTCKSWILIFIFYAIAYAFLSGFFLTMLYVFLSAFIKEQQPRLTGYQSLLKLNPGLNFNPRLSVISTLLHVANYDSSINVEYVLRANTLLNNYRSMENNVPCHNQIPASFPEVPCHFDTSVLGECVNPETSISQGRPCVYIRLNKVYGWLPEFANQTQSSDILIDCSGDNAIDSIILGNPTYFPETIVDGKPYGVIRNLYFPYIKQTGYQAPMAAVQFRNIKPSTLALVQCRVHGVKNAHSSVGFEFIVDGKPS